MFAGSRSALTSVSSVAARTSLAGPAAARRMATAAAQATTVESHPSSESSYLASSNASSESPKSFLHLPGRSRPTTPLENDISPQKASQYISSILSLPPSREMPPALALRILTHKSYRGAHSLGQGYAERTSDASHHGSAPNNSRLTFLGKRAFHSYLLMFIHQQAMLQSTAASVPGTEFQQLNLTNSEGQAVTLDEMITAIASEGNLGKAVGSRWALEQVMRWQSNLVSFLFGYSSAIPALLCSAESST